MPVSKPILHNRCEHMSATKKISMVAVCIGLALLIGIFLYSKMHSSNARRALPEGATDIKEYKSESLLKGTSCYLLKARLRETMLAGYALKLGLTNIYSSQTTYLGMTFRVDRAPQWWDPPASKEGALYRVASRQTKNDYEMLGYTNGFVYYIHAIWPYRH